MTPICFGKPIWWGRQRILPEQLTNLDALPLTGFKVAAFPLKIKGASAGARTGGRPIG